MNKTITLTDTQIKLLPTGWVEIVPAPGSGKVIIPYLSIWSVDTTAGVYTNTQISPPTSPAGSSLYLVWDAPNFYNDAGGYVQTHGFLDVARKGFGFTSFYSGNINQVGIAGNNTSPFSELCYPQNPSLGYDNAALYIVAQNNLPLNNGNFTGGNVANTLKVKVFYDIVTL